MWLTANANRQLMQRDPEGLDALFETGVLLTEPSRFLYGRLFPRGDDGAELAAAEKAFLG